MQVSQAEASAAYNRYHSRNFFRTRPSAGKLLLGSSLSAEHRYSLAVIQGATDLNFMSFGLCCRASTGEGVFPAILGSSSKGRCAPARCQAGLYDYCACIYLGPPIRVYYPVRAH